MTLSILNFLASAHGSGSTGDPTAVAIITAIPAILAAYWQFVYKPRKKRKLAAIEKAKLAKVVQSPTFNVSPNVNVSYGNSDLDTRLKEQTVRQNEIAAETTCCRQIILVMVAQTKKSQGSNNLSFSDEQLHEWAGPYSHRLHAVMDDLKSENRVRSPAPGQWQID